MSINFFTELIRDRYRERNGIPFNTNSARIIARLMVRAKNALDNPTNEKWYAETILDQYMMKCFASAEHSEYCDFLLNNQDNEINQTTRCVV